MVRFRKRIHGQAHCSGTHTTCSDKNALELYMFWRFLPTYPSTNVHEWRVIDQPFEWDERQGIHLTQQYDPCLENVQLFSGNYSNDKFFKMFLRFLSKVFELECSMRKCWCREYLKTNAFFPETYLELRTLHADGVTDQPVPMLVELS